MVSALCKLYRLLDLGMGFRPQPNVLENLIHVNQTTDNYDSDPYIKNLNQYLQVCMY